MLRSPWKLPVAHPPLQYFVIR
ncbi:hypothetical protein BVI2075_300045 [Burkholderia vietnamiensis]|nr:hypothetical protein BVI2075_300045 [Burkholderia vietnamiensis]